MAQDSHNLAQNSSQKSPGQDGAVNVTTVPQYQSIFARLIIIIIIIISIIVITIIIISIIIISINIIGIISIIIIIIIIIVNSITILITSNISITIIVIILIIIIIIIIITIIRMNISCSDGHPKYSVHSTHNALVGSFCSINLAILGRKACAKQARKIEHCRYLLYMEVPAFALQVPLIYGGTCNFQYCFWILGWSKLAFISLLMAL